MFPLTRFQMMNHSLSSREMAASYLPILPEFKQIMLAYCIHTTYGKQVDEKFPREK